MENVKAVICKSGGKWARSQARRRPRGHGNGMTDLNSFLAMMLDQQVGFPAAAGLGNV